MPKFMTYQRPTPAGTSGRSGKPGAPFGKPGKVAPRPAPDTGGPKSPAEPKLPEKLSDLLKTR